ncbi:Methionine-tRNA synthetase, type 2 [Moorella glycerini]|uniref:Methionine--tRNA ligase n=1 Tax=Neomoorella stamsii TaxID=1266720 RepID=A0A9X7J2G2_9FIRM|nr:MULTISPECIES: methionine--tRNA ligase [Moorella]PRR72648.1 Methionine--tRNA ligase [Moorella stamsii]CEP67805.1 Methionine-tRNA synthetase, type 2 [Moorella glycerini]
MGDKVFYVTTPIYYPSDKLHIGHALTTTMADTLARYKRLRGYDVYFLTGSDEHGQKIQRKAREADLPPQKYVDRIVATFQELWRRLNISYNDFIRTTEPRHTRVVQHLLQKIYDQGDIYKSTYEGWYCTPCETFWTERQLKDGNCPDCGRPVELVKEESYFFRMSKYADRLLQYIKEHPDFILPVSRRNEMISFIEGGLEDLCISRTTFDWGIPVPMDPRHVIYVWFDALTNYISALGYGTEDDHLFRKYWPAAVHLVGKDIVRFHTIIWPIILMAAGIDPPRQVFGHGWLLVDGGKMSKSKGNVVDPMVLIDRYGADAIRYFLLREMPYGADGYYSEEALITRLNTDLANDFGNLLSRTTAMIEKFNGGVIAAPSVPEPLDEELKAIARAVPDEVDAALNNFEFARALTAIWRLVNRANKYIEETAPWALAKDPLKKPRLQTVLYNLAEAMRQATIMVGPFMPGVPARVWEQLGLSDVPAALTWESLATWGGIPAGTRVRRGPALFPRIELNEQEGEGPVAVQEKPAATSPAVKEETVAKPGEEEITIEEFARIKLRVAEVLAAEKVANADKLLKLEVKVGDERRTIVAGIARYYRPEELVGKKVVIVANLKPAKLRGIVSQGMVLAAVADDTLSLVTPERAIQDGAQVR